MACGYVTMGTVLARDFLPEEKGGTGEGFVPNHVFGGLIAFTLLLLGANIGPELSKAFAVMIATFVFLYQTSPILERMFFPQDVQSK